MIKKLLLPLILLFGFQAHYVLAVTSIIDKNLNKLQKEINSNSFGPAWETAQQLKDDYLGDITFDFLYGVAALTNNQAEHAVFSFERVIANKPDWLDAHYLLAKSNYAIGNYHSTITSCKLLIENPNTPNKLKESAKTLIASAQTQLNKQSLYISQRISLGLGYDSNINSGTTEDNIFLPSLGQSIILNEESKEQSDKYSVFNYQISGDKTLSQISKIIFYGKGTLYHFKGATDYNRIYADMNLKYQHAFDFATLTAGFRWTPLWLNNDFYRTRTVFTTGIEKQLSKKWALTTDIELGKMSNKVNKNFNTDIVSSHLYTHFFLNKLKHSFGVSHTNEKSDIPEQNHISYKLTSLNYSILWPISPKLFTKGMIGFQQKKYQDIQPTFLEERNDDMWLGSLNIQYTHSKTWSYNLNFNAQNKDSNVTLFSYQRSDISLMANMNF